MEQSSLGDAIVSEFETYEDYLDSQISKNDMFYLEDEDMARQLVELGYRGSGEIMKREEFEARKHALEVAKQNKLRNIPKTLSSDGKDVSHCPLMKALAAKEEMVQNGKLTAAARNASGREDRGTRNGAISKKKKNKQQHQRTHTTIVFIRDRNAQGQEVSGYIDFAHRLRMENFSPYFEGKRKLLPRPTDLSFFNWETLTSTSNSSPNFLVIADKESGLIFKNKRDRKIVNVDPEADPGDNSRRIELRAPNYLQVVIYDHVTRRKT